MPCFYFKNAQQCRQLADSITLICTPIIPQIRGLVFRCSLNLSSHYKHLVMGSQTLSLLLSYARKWSLLCYRSRRLLVHKQHLFSTAKMPKSPKGAWFCKTVIRVWTRSPSLAPPVGFNKVHTKCSSISGSESSMADIWRACKWNQKVKLLESPFLW